MNKIIASLLLLGLALPGVLWGAAQLWGESYLLYHIEPSTDFDTGLAGGAPDYRDARYWAARPGKPSAAGLVPGGRRAGGSAPVDVFYIHPTSYISGDSWNAPLFTDTRAWEMVDIILGAQASAFNACCQVYAPHYRQATLWSFIDRETGNGDRALDLAYSDIARAFQAFLAETPGRPFIIASHSQGTYHALRLLSESIDGTPLQGRLVAAYLLGYWVPLDTFGRTLRYIAPCESATDTGCVVHWSSYGERGVQREGVPHWYPTGHELSDDKPLLCTNPLNWQRDGGRVEASSHPGALYVSHGGSRLNTFFNYPARVKLDSLPPLMPAYTWAECRDGLLRVADQEDSVFSEVTVDTGQDYHMIDYNLFYQSISENARQRAQQFTGFRLSSLKAESGIDRGSSG